MSERKIRSFFESLPPQRNFQFKNKEGTPLEFVICVRRAQEKQKLVQMIEDRGGIAYTTLDEERNNAAVFLDYEATTWDFDGDVFDAMYIWQCISRQTVLDLSFYLKQSSNMFVEGFNYMTIFYTREYTWKTVPAEYHLDQKMRHTFINLGVTYIRKVKMTSTESELPKKDDVVISKPVESLNRKEEDISIEQSAQKDNEEVKETLPRISESIKTTTAPTIVEEVQSELPIDSRMLLTNEGKKESDGSSKSSIACNIDNSKSGEPGEFGANKRTRMAYGLDEKEAILRYIVKHKLYDYMKGVAMWKNMEHANICPIRTWQSMKEHTIKTLSKELNKFDFLTPEEKERFMKSFSKDLS